MANSKGKTWQRLTRAEATNYLIIRLILRGFDPRNELVLDGDPGPFLERAGEELDIDWSKNFPAPGRELPPDHKLEAIPFWKIWGGIAIIEAAQEVGYQGKTVKGIVDYLRSLPMTGPIGGRRSLAP